MIIRPLFALALLVAIPLQVQANDFPTQARVEYVLGCMNDNGGQSYDNLYRCVCQVDQLAARFSYDEYTEAEAFTYLRSTPGERGGMFRDPPRAGELVDRLAAARADIAKICPSKQS